jgi:hypothetical protein
MNRVLVLSLIGALLGGVLGLVIATADEAEGPVFIASDQPITTAQVVEKLQADGWVDIKVAELGRYFEATGAKDGRGRRIMINPLTSPLTKSDLIDSV